MDELRELAVRTALFVHLTDLLHDRDDEYLRWDQTQSFEFNGERFAIRQVRGKGINKPAGLEAALSITTAFTPFGKQPPYEDLVGSDGFARYKYEGLDPNYYTNRALRRCMEFALPLVYFLGVQRGVYKPEFPVYVIGEDPQNHEFALSYHRSDVGRDTSTLTAPEKRYISQETRRRLHQPIFREQVLNAYGTKCAVCSLKHRQLLDAAHIIRDAKPDGDPVVPNGIAMCKIHHAAYDRNFLGIRPDYGVVINSQLLEEVDGPMLKHGLQEMHGEQLHVPKRAQLRPDPVRLERRFEEFKRAS